MSKFWQWFTNAGTFFGEVKAEWKKVTRPSRQDVIATTAVVVVTSVIFALFLTAADIVILWLYNGIFTVLDKVKDVF